MENNIQTKVNKIGKAGFSRICDSDENIQIRFRKKEIRFFPHTDRARICKLYRIYDPLLLHSQCFGRASRNRRSRA